ncbi:anti-sigma F factor antagonist [Peptococcaceae bacterium 1198_IL3148]
MQWEISVNDYTLLARLSGEFDLSFADRLRKELDTVIQNEQVRNIVFTFTDVSYIDSSGLGVILGRYKRISQFGGKMAIVDPQPQVRRILELSGLLTIISEYNDEVEALEKIV